MCLQGFSCPAGTAPHLEQLQLLLPWLLIAPALLKPHQLYGLTSSDRWVESK